jgi:NhaP-type Na+/H+ or K+/H+ antiporter
VHSLSLFYSCSLTFLSGPYGAGIFDPRSWGNHSEVIVNQITLEFTRVVLAIGVFAIGVELPKAYMRRHWKSLLFLLVPVMTWVRNLTNTSTYDIRTSINLVTRVGLCQQL